MSFMENGGFSIADVMAMSGNNDNCFGGNGGGAWIFFLFFLLAAGGDGGGLFGGGNNRAADVNGAFTRAELNEGLNFNQLDNSLRGIGHDVSDLGMDMMGGFNQLGNTMIQGFNGLNTGILQSGFATERAIDNTRYAMLQNGCETNRNIDAVRYDGAKNTCEIINSNALNTRDIIDAQHNGIQRVLEFITNNKMESLRDRVQLAEMQLSNNAQTQSLVHALRPFPQPAYITGSPYETSPAAYGGACGTCSLA